ncbi:MAG TPA: hypothetical protein VF575_05320 [Candidatus Saccharimonadales bacterium]|jgi:hypothetical protein
MNETPMNPNNSSRDPKSQIVEKLKSTNSILVTVSANPSIDQLAACLAMTMVLNKIGKSATAVFSGKVPSVLEFLHPDETLQTTTDSLRDFIIAIDKSKADKLRYKLEDEVVKIFITPYKTSITEADLKYSAGDFNVELILALGVKHQQDLDAAITAHGRIFHDAVTMSINAAPGGDFGVANWEDLNVSSLSEQVASLIDALDPRLLDADIATALLTGIVAETSRFSNVRTRPSSLTASAALLAAGADQQLVNLKLQELIGTVVDLRAGDEIAPTVSDPSLVRHDVAEELVIDEHGAFKQIENTLAPSGEVVPQSDEATATDKGIETAADDNANPSAESASRVTAELHADVAAQPDQERAAGDASDSTAEPRSTPAQAADTSDQQTPPEAELANPTASEMSQAAPSEPDDAASARQAVEAALSSLDAVAHTEPAVVINPSPQTQEPSEPSESHVDAVPISIVEPAAPQFQNPLITPISPNQPSYSNPATMTNYDGPQAPTAQNNEPAPLSMSPADQAFTMPMPPASAMPAANRPMFPPPPTPPEPAGNVPPPLPPPMMPGA